ncbi:hypothetical protein [Hyphomicrobium sp.]|uniref:hypothetical protein n=1 Tax=Hyphomicrobium sp. TaxID=82 RepID=UPI003F70D1EE
MRGRKAGHDRDSSRAAAPRRTRGMDALPVLATVDESFPVTAEELDAIESFLLEQLNEFLAANDRADSEVPQRTAQYPAVHSAGDAP